MDEQQTPQLDPYLMTHDGWELVPQNLAYAEALRIDDSALGTYLAGIKVLSGTTDCEDPLADIVTAESAGNTESGNDDNSGSEGTVPTIRTGFQIHDNWDV